MNTGSTHNPQAGGEARAFDERVRAVHAQALAATPARVRLQLRPRRATRPHALRGWSVTAAFAIGLVAVGLLWQRPAPDTLDVPAIGVTTPSAPSPDTSTAPDPLDLDDAYAALDESPELYLWLESSDASAMLGADPSMTAGSGGAVTE